MTTARGMPTAAHSSQSCTVVASTPLTAETTKRAASAARRPARSSPTKSGEPGVSSSVILWPSCSTVATPRETERCWRTSTSSVSRQVVPSSTRPARGSAPVATSRASARVVFPDPAWPTRATLRTLPAGRGAGAVAVSFAMSAAPQLEGPVMDDGRGPGRVEQRGVPVGLPPHAIGRASPGFVALHDLADALRFPLVGGVDDDAISDMRFHGDLPAAHVV